jgi:hypothetical protein
MPVQQLPITKTVTSGIPNCAVRSIASVRGINGVWSGEIIHPTGNFYTTLPKPPVPSIELTLDYDTAGKNGSFIITDMSHWKSFRYYSGDSNTHVIFKLYEDDIVISQIAVQPTLERTGLGRGINDDATHIANQWGRILEQSKLQAGRYKWTVQYQSINNNYTEETTLRYTLPAQRTIDWTSTKLTKDNLLTIPKDISDRKRVSLNIGEVDAIERTFSEKSTLTTKPREFPKSIYKLSLSVSEAIVDKMTGLILGEIEYFISFDGGKTYYPINPLEREDDPYIAKILTINSGLSVEQKASSEQPAYSYIEMKFEPR